MTGKIDVERDTLAEGIVQPNGHRPAEVVGSTVPTIQVASAETPAVDPQQRPSVTLAGMHFRLPAAMRALAHRNFRLFWSGQLISLIGTWMQMIARGWLVLELTHSPFWLGMVGFANAVPVLFLSLWGGVLADRFPKRTLVIVTQAVSMVMAFLLAALTYTGTVQVWQVIAISLVLGVVFSFDAPARQAMTVDLVGKEDLMNAVALNSAIFNGARVVGPAIGAIALAWQGPALAFFLNGLSYLAVLAGLYMIKLPAFTRKTEVGNSLHRIMEGLRYVRHNQTIFVLMGLVAVVSIFAFPYATLMPIFADSVLRVGEHGYGTLMVFAGIGALVGALSLAVQSGRESVKRGRIILFGSVGLPIFLGVFALSGNYLLSLAMLFGVGWTMISINATVNTIVQTNVPDELRGRVNGVFALLFIGMAPFGSLLAGILAARFGVQTAVFLGALVSGLAVLYILLQKRAVFETE